MKLQKRIALTALFVAVVLWVLSNRQSSADYLPQSTIKLNGIIEVTLMCDQMVRMKDVTIVEGRKRQDAAMLCGSDTTAECLPYYVQWRVLSELNYLLEEAISSNCSSA